MRIGSFRDWASMMRLPNVPTVWSNVFTAWVLAKGVFNSAYDQRRFGYAVLGGTLLYVGGTILNDFADVKFDREHRPERPIPSQRVARGMVGTVAALLLLGGSAAFLEIGSLFAMYVPMSIIFYTLLHKEIPNAGMIFMGCCRALLAIAVSLVAATEQVANPIARLQHTKILTSLPKPGAEIHLQVPTYWWISLFVYICAISWIARGETKPWRRHAVGIMLGAMPLLDAAFIFAGGLGSWAMVPVGCAALALLLRLAAEAT